MSKNLRTKALAFGSMLGLAMSGVVAMPASASPGDVTILPDGGSTWAVFLGNEFDVIANYPDYLNEDEFGVKLSNSNGEAFAVEVDTDDSNVDGYEAYAIDSSGRVSSVVLPYHPQGAVVDFDALDAVSVILTSVDGRASDDVDFIDIHALVANDDSYDYATFGDGDMSLDIQLWNESGARQNWLTVDPLWASSVETITFFDPKNVVVTPRIERFVSWDNDDTALYRFNTAGSEELGFSLGFSKDVNLDQIDIQDWVGTLYFGNEEYVGNLNDDSYFDAETLWGTSERDDASRFYLEADIGEIIDGLILDEPDFIALVAAMYEAAFDGTIYSDDSDAINTLFDDSHLWIGLDDTQYLPFGGDFSALDNVNNVDEDDIADLLEAITNSTSDGFSEMELSTVGGLEGLRDLQDEVSEGQDAINDLISSYESLVAGSEADLELIDDLVSDLLLAEVERLEAIELYEELEVYFRALEDASDATITPANVGQITAVSQLNDGPIQASLDADLARLNVLYASYNREEREVIRLLEDLDDIAEKFDLPLVDNIASAELLAGAVEDEVEILESLTEFSDLVISVVFAAQTEFLNDWEAAVVDLFDSVMNSDIIDELGAGQRYRIGVQHEDASARDRDFVSTVFTVPAGSEDAADVSVTVGDAVNASQEDADDLDIDLRVGTKAFTYTAQLLDADGDSLAEAGVPVMLVITATGWSGGVDVATPFVLSASGSPVEVTGLDGAMIATAVTNSKGQASFTITHSGAANGDSYSIEPYFADADGAEAAGAVYEAAYQSTAPAELEADTSLLAGENVTVSFTVTDQFGNPVSTAGTKPLNVELTATDADDLELTAAVDANGKVSFTFANYVAKGSSDVLSAQLFTGTANSPTQLLSPVLVEIFNSADAASVEVAASANAVVTYYDFITGAGTTANRPANAEGTLYSGTVLDANGAGVAGAVVTVSGDGFQFRKADSGDYSVDSITVATDTNGEFSVRFWVHEANATGKALTVTSGGKTASTTVKSYLPANLGGDNLSFTWSLPSVVVKNTTYAVTAKLTDKWGNPVSTVGSTTMGVSFLGNGSVAVNNSAVAVGRNFDKDGNVTVFLRSAADIAGPGEITATLGAASYSAWVGSELGTSTLTDLGANATDVARTAWDETKWNRELSSDVEVLETAPAATDAKLNAGSFNGYVAVYAKGYKGATLSWKIAGQWFKTTITEDYQVFQRKTAAVGVDVNVELYINGVKPAAFTKTVTTK